MAIINTYKPFWGNVKMGLTLSQRINELRNKLVSVDNLNKNATGGDMKFYIFDYDPKEELRVRSEIKKAVKANPEEIIEFDLYDMMLDVIKENGYFETIQHMEREYDKTLLLAEVFQPLLGLGKTSNPILNRFKATVEDDGKHIILVTGVGKSYPVVRSHTILNNLQSLFKRNPVVMIYPGRYEVRKKMTLRLFDRLDDDNYYRAFPLIDRGEE